MKKIYEILTNMKARGVQRYLTEANGLTHRLEEFFQAVPESPPNLEKSRILIIGAKTPRSLYSIIFAIRFAKQFNANLYVLHTGVIASILLEEASDLDVNISLIQKVDRIQLSDINQIIKEHDINLIITSNDLPLLQKTVHGFSVPVLLIEPSS